MLDICTCCVFTLYRRRKCWCEEVNLLICTVKRITNEAALKVRLVIIIANFITFSINKTKAWAKINNKKKIKKNNNKFVSRSAHLIFLPQITAFTFFLTFSKIKIKLPTLR